jgi:hypothetical protein
MKAFLRFCTSKLRIFSYFDLFKSEFSDSIYTTRSQLLRHIGHLVLLISIISFPIIKLNFEDGAPPLLVVDSTTPSPVLRRTMTLHMEIDFHTTPCDALGFLWQPQTAPGTQPLLSLKKQRLDSSGKVASSSIKSDRRGATKDADPVIRPRSKDDTDATCGSCYGAAGDSCCDTCADVFLAYRQRRWAAPMREHIKQCEGVTNMPEIAAPLYDLSMADKQEVEKLKNVANEGCRVSGEATVSRSPGTLHVNSGGVSRNTWHVVMGSKATMKHTIRSFSVSDGERPQEEKLEMIVSDETPSHQYYMTLVSVQRPHQRQNSYKVISKYFPVMNDPLGPGVHFRFDFDPLKVVMQDERNLAASLVDWLGFFGGLVSIISFF